LPYDFAAEAARHREMAQEYRTVGELFLDEGMRVHYRELAEAFDGLADNELRVADNLRQAPVQPD
jgi:uncharacterized protein YfbU (UPF0304 family)